MGKQRAQKERLQLTQDADTQERSHGVQASIGFVGHDYARAAIQRDSGSVKGDVEPENNGERQEFQRIRGKTV